MLSATRALLAQNGAVGDGTDSEEKENPFLDDEPAAATPVVVPDGLPLLRATRDLLGDETTACSDDVPGDVLALEAEVAGAEFYPYRDYDRVSFERALESKQWTLARVAGRRILRSSANATAPPPRSLEDLVAAVDANALASADDRRAFQTAMVNGDYAMATIIGEQIVGLSSLAERPGLVDV